MLINTLDGLIWQEILIIRFSTFFILLGGVLLLLFAVSTQVPAENHTYYLLIGLVLIAFGVFLRRRAPKKPPSPPARFRMFRRRKQEDQSEDENCD